MGGGLDPLGLLDWVLRPMAAGMWMAFTTLALLVSETRQLNSMSFSMPVTKLWPKPGLQMSVEEVGTLKGQTGKMPPDTL